MCPETGETVELVAPTVSTYLMNAHLRHLSEHLGPDRHAVLIMDGAGWHVSNDLVVPENVTTLLLPPYSPELNPVERLWLYLREHKLSNRLLPAGYELDKLLGDLMLELTPELVKSVCRVPWLEPAA